MSPSQDELRTARLWLRRWRSDDREPLAALTADPEVMRHFPACLSREESDALFDRIGQHFADHGFGLWAVEVPGVTPFAGFVGLAIPPYTAHFTPCVEVGWRLTREYWGHGYATEAAREAVAYGFTQVGLDELVSMTVPANIRSRGVMERIGMTRDPEGDFDHPRLPKGHPLERHVLYRLRRAEWEAVTAR